MITYCVRDAGIALIAYIWASAHHLTDETPLDELDEFFMAPPSRELKVLELGSGCGIVGIGLSQFRPNSNVLLTDLPEAMNILDYNISQARPAHESQLRRLCLNWDENVPEVVAEEHYDLILVSDCTYNSDSIPALIKTLSSLKQNSSNAAIGISMKVRHPSEAVFFDLMFSAGFIVTGHKIISLPDRQRVKIGQSLETIEIYSYCSA